MMASGEAGRMRNAVGHKRNGRCSAEMIVTLFDRCVKADSVRIAFISAL